MPLRRCGNAVTVQDIVLRVVGRICKLWHSPAPPGWLVRQDLPPFFCHVAGGAGHVDITGIEQLRGTVAHVELQAREFSVACLEVIGGVRMAQAVMLPGAATKAGTVAQGGKVGVLFLVGVTKSAGAAAAGRQARSQAARLGCISIWRWPPVFLLPAQTGAFCGAHAGEHAHGDIWAQVGEILRGCTLGGAPDSIGSGGGAACGE